MAGALESSALCHLVFVLFISFMSLLLVRTNRMEVAIFSTLVSLKTTQKTLFAFQSKSSLLFFFHHNTPGPPSNSPWIQRWYLNKQQITTIDGFFFLSLWPFQNYSVDYFTSSYLFVTFLTFAYLFRAAPLKIFYSNSAVQPQSFSLISLKYIDMELTMGNTYS